MQQKENQAGYLSNDWKIICCTYSFK